MNFLSICSGIEAASVAWNPLGWKAVGFSEIEPFPSAVLAHHYPNTPNHGDMTTFKDWEINGPVDLVCGGTPCQSFSVAGLRKGMDDPRGNLMLTFCGIVDRFRPRWVVWENVPGVLSSNGGRDFGAFLGALGELGYGFAYRILDAQYFGVPQRRRRVFVVGYLGDWRPPAAVLFERHSLQGHPAPSRKAGQENTSVAGTLAASGGGLTRPAGNANELDFCVTAKCLVTKTRIDMETETLLPIALAENTIGRQPQNGGNGNGFTVGGPMYTLNATGVHGVCGTMVSRQSSGGFSNSIDHASAGYMVPVTESAVRRLTPTECERLQGFPDGHTAIPWRKKPASDCPDGPRYKALGNSWAVPVARWIGTRIEMVEEILCAP